MLIRRRVRKRNRNVNKSTLGVTKEIGIKKELTGDYINLDIFRIQEKSGSIQTLDYQLAKKVIQHPSEEEVIYEVQINGEAHIKLVYKGEQKTEDIRITIPFEDQFKLLNYCPGSQLDLKAFVTNIRYKEIAGPPIIVQGKVILAIMQK